VTAGRGRAKLPAQLPPKSVVGLDPAWSRLVATTDHSGQDVEWHLLDSYAQRSDVEPRLTLLCVHGNPSWSFLWRSVLAAAPDDLRVIAVDQLDMGFSERTGRSRRLADRVEDLSRLTERLGLNGPVVAVAHDWGGPVALGWALQWNTRSDRTLAGVVLTNTAVHQPAGSRASSLIRAARSRPMLKPVTVSSTAFIRGAVDMCRPRPSRAVRDGYLAPYRSADRRHAIADFVADIPLEPEHPTASTLDSIAAGLADLSSIPVALFWGPNDPVFSDLYLHDFEQRLPHADVHRFAGAHHFVQEEGDVAGAIFDWVGFRCLTGEDQSRPHPLPHPRPQASSGGEANQTISRPMWSALSEAEPLKAAVLELSGSTRHTTFDGLSVRVSEFGAGLASFGIQRGSRVALMIPPGIDLNTALYGCWRAGVVAVVIDSALGPANMTKAIRSANPEHLIAIPKALAAAKVLGWPGRRISTDEIDAICAAGRSPDRGSDAGSEPGSNAWDGRDLSTADGSDLALLGFTSGSTGPSKGVLYEHRQLEAQRDLLASIYKVEATDALVAAFAPFALYGPALGITSVVPDMDITKPATLTAVALAEAVAEVDATLVFASPAALANVVATAADLTDIHREALGGVRLLLSAGAPVNPELFARAQTLVPNAEAHTPYGMTEVLPVADVSLVSLAAASGQGVCVGPPCVGVEVRIEPLTRVSDNRHREQADGPVMGEVEIRADHVMHGYDRLWWTQFKARTADGWHRSGDVGWIDDQSRLWIGGRVGDVISTAVGPLMPVPLELAAESVAGVSRAAAVGVGPQGCQVVAIVVETTNPPRHNGLAPAELVGMVREAVEASGGPVQPGPTVAAVLSVRRLPVDRRHNSKIDRRRVAKWAETLLSGATRSRL